MARTPIAVQIPKGPYPALPVAANSLDIVFSAADAANDNLAAFANNPRLLVLVRNAHASNAGTFNITSAPIVNRTGDITGYSLNAGETAGFIVDRTGWRQSTGDLHFDASDATMMFALLAI